MAQIDAITGKVQAKILDASMTKSYTEDLGYIVNNENTGMAYVISDSDTLSAAIRDDINAGLQALTSIVDGTVTTKFVTYTMEVAN